MTGWASGERGPVGRARVSSVVASDVASGVATDVPSDVAPDAVTAVATETDAPSTLRISSGLSLARDANRLSFTARGLGVMRHVPLSARSATNALAASAARATGNAETPSLAALTVELLAPDGVDALVPASVDSPALVRGRSVVLGAAHSILRNKRPSVAVLGGCRNRCELATRSMARRWISDFMLRRIRR
jgi:hypothetical protein